jgi:hypothetical protein
MQLVEGLLVPNIMLKTSTVKLLHLPGLVARTCNPCTREAEFKASLGYEFQTHFFQKN